ncbi:hypothetical protein U3516DRAFT_742676 [Neocallimastix sp. 'constans']
MIKELNESFSETDPSRLYEIEMKIKKLEININYEEQIQISLLDFYINITTNIIEDNYKSNSITSKEHKDNNKELWIIDRNVQRNYFMLKTYKNNLISIHYLSRVLYHNKSSILILLDYLLKPGYHKRIEREEHLQHQFNYINEDQDFKDNES